MKLLSKRSLLALAIGLAILFTLAGQFSKVSPTAAQDGLTPQDSPSAPIERPFQLPFAQPASPDSWLMAQPYGNTTGAYRRRFSTYGASGGIHFGLDLAAPCGTEAVAIADGVVFAVDGPFGSPPHNLMIDHPELGYASLYGHLVEAPDLVPGQRVRQGEIIALTGDSRETCYSSPHLHLEIRDLNHIRKFNPVALIDANWDNLALVGSDGRDFARDLDEPRKWQSLYDQPEARTAGPIVNDFDNPWPLDWEKGILNGTTRESLVQPAASEPGTVPTTPLRTTPIGVQITSGDCCTQPYWNEGSDEVRFIDQPEPDAPLGIWGVDLTQPQLETHLVTEHLGVYSPDGTLVAYPDRETGLAMVERLADGQLWALDTQGRGLRFAPDSRHVIWTAYDEDAPRDSRVETTWLANVDGSDARILLQARRTDSVAWLSADELLMTRRIPGGSDQQLFTLSLADGGQSELLQVSPRMRGLALSPDKRYLVYYVTFETESEKNGVWLVDLQNQELPAQKLPFFGTYRWRDNQSLIYIPLDPDATSHEFYEYDILTKETQPLFPAGTNLAVTNNDWQVSPDGRKIVMVAANGMELDGVWVLEMDLDPDDLSNAQGGIFRVNARTLATDNDFRNRAIKNRILRTNDYEFVTFTSTEVVGLPETGAVGETYTFQVVGDLTITDVTKQVTFDVEVTATSETQIEGIATTAFPYTDFELFIPDAPAVDTVDDEVRLELEFVAGAV